MTTSSSSRARRLPEVARDLGVGTRRFLLADIDGPAEDAVANVRTAADTD